MNLSDVIPLSWKVGAVVLLAALLVGWHVHKVHEARADGIRAESLRRDGIDAINTVRANTALAAANDKVLAATRQVLETQSRLQQLQKENDHEKLLSSRYQSDLLAGRERMRIQTTGARCLYQAGAPASAGAAAVDQGTGNFADIAPAVASDLERIREQHNDAVRRLNGCVASYDAVKEASDSLDK